MSRPAFNSATVAAIALATIAVAVPSVAWAQGSARPPCLAIPNSAGQSSSFLCDDTGNWKVDEYPRLAIPQAGRPPKLGSSAESAETNAKVRQGVANFTGIGARRNKSEGIRLIVEAAASGNRYAQFNLAVLNERGDLGQVELPTAIANYQAAANQGFDAAQNTLGVHYLHGEGVAQDRVQAELWFKAAAAQGYTKSYINLAVIYTDPRQPSNYNPDLATSWLRKALPSSPGMIEYKICIVQAQAANVQKPANVDRLTKVLVWCSLATHDLSPPPSEEYVEGGVSGPPEAEKASNLEDWALKQLSALALTMRDGFAVVIRAKNLRSRCLSQGVDSCGI